MLSEARSEINVQELNQKVQQWPSVELFYPANQIKNSSRRQVWHHSDLEIRERALQETGIRTLQEMEELQKICSTEGERTQRLKMDELVRQELQESRSTVIFSVRFKFRNCKISELFQRFQGFPWS